MVYVNHKSYDYDGNVITKGVPDPFIDSLVHDSIIVQIPLLHGQVNNRLERVLSVFDQTKADADDPHILSLDERNYAGDESMEYIVHRLTQAAADSDMRQDMNVEDEYYSAIENRDTAIMNRDKTIKEQEKQLKANAKQLSENAKQLSEDAKRLSENAKRLSEKDTQIRSLVLALKEKGMSLSQISSIVGLDEEKLKSIIG